MTALDAGADDYLVKPFAMQELLARMRAVGRRAHAPNAQPTLRFGALEIDLSHEVVRLGEPVHLTPTERRLLRVFATNPGKLLTHNWLLQQVWGPGYAGESDLLRVYVQQLRRKIRDEPARPLYITTEPGLGYRWTDETIAEGDAT